MATTLATLDIERQRDENGNEIVPTGEYQHRIISYGVSRKYCKAGPEYLTHRHPLPHPISMKPRSQAAVDLLRLAVNR
jgi:hypothetical protein